MNKIYLIFLSLVLLAGCNSKMKKEPKKNPAIPVKYITTKKIETKENFHGTEIIENYRWLENDTAADVKQWVDEQNKVTFAYLNQIPFRKDLQQALEKNFNYEKYSQPFKEGDYYFFFKNDGLQNQSVLYIQKGLDGKPDVFLDPNTLSDDGTAALGGLTFSMDHKYCAYNISRAGSDWSEIHIKEIETRKEYTDEVIEWVKFSGAAWHGNGFYYSRYDAPQKGMEFSSQNNGHMVYYHIIGTKQSADELIYKDEKNPKRYHGISLTEDERFLFLYISEGASDGTRVLFKDLIKGDKEWKVLWDDFNFEFEVIDNEGDQLIVNTNYKANNRQIVSVSSANPAIENWKVLVPEEKELIASASTAGGKLFVTYLKDAYTKAYFYNLDGTEKKEINLPGIGTAGGFGGKREDKICFYSYTSFNYAPTIFKYNIATGESEIFRQPKTVFKPENYETKQVFYTSKDGTKVPMFLLYRKGLKLDGNNPCYQYGYGGFNINLTPSFSVQYLMFADQGGVIAIPNLRGGGEYGKEWHEAGTKERKQNVFDDFIAASEYLIREKYTSSQKLAICGRSNGGLLVGACMIQRPDLYKVCLPGVGVLDMLRFHKFTIGWGWINDYGCADSAEDFKYLIKYSPLHNLKETAYPATLITTGDHDDRVVPAHSFKFAATLQEKHNGNQPVLIRIDVNAGHGAGKPTTKIIEEAADVWSFVMYNLDMQPDFSN